MSKLPEADDILEYIKHSWLEFGLNGVSGNILVICVNMTASRNWSHGAQFRSIIAIITIFSNYLIHVTFYKYGLTVYKNA